MSTVLRPFPVAQTPSTIRPPLSDVRPASIRTAHAPVSSDTEVVGQVVSRFGIGVIFPTIDLCGRLAHGDSANSVFHSIFLAIRNPVRQGTAVAGCQPGAPGGIPRFGRTSFPLLDQPIDREKCQQRRYVLRLLNCREQLLAREFLEFFLRRHHVDNPPSVSGGTGYVHKPTVRELAVLE